MRNLAYAALRAAHHTHAVSRPHRACQHLIPCSGVGDGMLVQQRQSNWELQRHRHWKMVGDQGSCWGLGMHNHSPSKLQRSSNISKLSWHPPAFTNQIHSLIFPWSTANIMSVKNGFSKLLCLNNVQTPIKHNATRLHILRWQDCFQTAHMYKSAVRNEGNVYGKER